MSKIKYLQTLLYAILTALILFILFNVFQSNWDNIHIIMRLILILSAAVLIVLALTYVNHRVRKNYGGDTREDFLNFPLQFIGTLVVISTLAKIGYDTLILSKQQHKASMRELSAYTQQVVVDGWEKDAMMYPSLNPLYQKIFSKMVSKHHFLTQQQWQSLKLSVPYVSYQGHEQQWHYAAKFLQEMANITRVFGLMQHFKINDQQDLAKSLNGDFAGWVQTFRMFLSVPIVRNVWEQYKYQYIDPHYTAWIQYYVINVIDHNPNYFSQSRKDWDKKVALYLKHTEHQGTHVKFTAK